MVSTVARRSWVRNQVHSPQSNQVLDSIPSWIWTFLCKRTIFTQASHVSYWSLGLQLKCSRWPRHEHVCVFEWPMKNEKSLLCAFLTSVCCLPSKLPFLFSGIDSLQLNNQSQWFLSETGSSSYSMLLNLPKSRRKLESTASGAGHLSAYFVRVLISLHLSQHLIPKLQGLKQHLPLYCTLWSPVTLLTFHLSFCLQPCRHKRLILG